MKNSKEPSQLREHLLVIESNLAIRKMETLIELFINKTLIKHLSKTMKPQNHL